MTTDVLPTAAPPQSRRLPLYYGWVNVVLAALAMTATLPGRTHGLGLITEGLVGDPALGVSRGAFSVLNFWAILLGSALCLPVGRLIDRFGVRGVLVGVAVGLGLAVLGMSAATGVVVLFVTLTLVRGLGQGALSVVSMAMIGKWFTRRLPVAMGVFTVLLAVGFILGNFAVGEPVGVYGWRATWAGVGVFLLVILAPLGGLLVRSTPESVGVAVDQASSSPQPSATREEGIRPGFPPGKVGSGAPLDLPLTAALRSPAFWAFTLATSLFNLTWSALTLFNEEILRDYGFDRQTYLMVMGMLVLGGLPANLIGGWLATRWPMGRLLCAGMLVLGGSLAVFPHLRETGDVILYGAALGVSGGIITVVFFSVYGHAFGRRHLGAIQATVQVISVFASALGPVLLQWSKQAAGDFTPFFYASALLAAVLGVVAWLARMPRPERSVGNP
jgi:MFS family permease